MLTLNFLYFWPKQCRLMQLFWEALSNLLSSTYLYFNQDALISYTDLNPTHSLSNSCTFTTSHTESDEHGTPPPRRQRAASIPRNAEELACHVLHGSLRLTPSRQQILSHSGIRLEERAASQQEGGAGQLQQTNSQVKLKQRCG